MKLASGAHRRQPGELSVGLASSLTLLSLALLAGVATAACSSDGGTGGTGGTGSAQGSTGGDPGTGGGGGNGGGSGSGSGGSTGGGSSGDPTLTAAELATEMGLGTNIGNTFDNTTIWETGWGQPLVTRAYLHGIASRGIKTVRVPVAWDTYASGGTINAAHLERVQEVVSWIEEEGMFAIVNIHWDGGWIFSENTAAEYTLTNETKTKFTSYWQQIASAFADVGPSLILEGLNEEAQFYVNGDENGVPDYAALNELNQLFVTTVRAEAGHNKTRALLIAGFATDIEQTCVDAFAVPSDPAGPGKLFLSLHYYTPFPFCLQDETASWGDPVTTWGTNDDRDELERLFDLAGDFSEQNQLPIILGEFAVTKGESYVREPASRTLWMQSVAEGALERGIVPVLWDTGSDISRADGSFSDEFQAVVDAVQ